MERKHFKRIGDKLGFNTPSAEAIFLILQELDAGYMYIMESSPFGQVMFVHKRLVVEEEKEEKKETKSTK